MTRRLSGNRRKAGVSGTPEQLAASVKNEGDQVLVKIIEIATADPDPECDPSMSM